MEQKENLLIHHLDMPAPLKLIQRILRNQLSVIMMLSINRQ